MAEEAIKISGKKKSMFIDKVKQLLPEGGNLNLCLTCGACSSGCPATGIEGMDPRKFLRMAALERLGDTQDLLAVSIKTEHRDVGLAALARLPQDRDTLETVRKLRHAATPRLPSSALPARDTGGRPSTPLIQPPASTMSPPAET